MMKKDTMNAMITILSNGRDFYAHDYELGDNVISALAREGMIEKTGNSKSEFLAIDHDEMYKKVKVYEWRVSRKGIKAVAKMVRKTANEMLAFAEGIEKLLAFAEAVESLC